MDDGTKQREHAEPGTNNEDQDKKNERGGCVHHRRNSRRRNKIAYGSQVVKRLGCATGDIAQIGFEGHVKEAAAQCGIDALAGLTHELATHDFERFHHYVNADDANDQHDERSGASAVDYPVIDFQHKQGGGQHEQAGDKAEINGLAVERYLLAYLHRQRRELL